MDWFFILSPAEVALLLLGTVIVIIVSVGGYFFAHSRLTKQRIYKNIRRLEYYTSGKNKNAEDCFELGNNYYRLKDYEKAELWYREALEVDPSYMDAFTALAELFKHNKEYDKLKDVFINLHKINPQDTEVIREMAWAHYYCAEYAEAIKTFEKLKKIIPGDIQTRYCLGLLYLDIGEKLKAIQEYKELKKFDEKKAGELIAYIYPEDEEIILSDQIIEKDESGITLKEELEKKSLQNKMEDSKENTDTPKKNSRKPDQDNPEL